MNEQLSRLCERHLRIPYSLAGFESGTLSGPCAAFKTRRGLSPPCRHANLSILS